MSNTRHDKRGTATALAMLLAVIILCAGCATSGLVRPVGGAKRLVAKREMEWFKGNTHTHTLWSDGDAAPEWAVAWYKNHGYDFLSLTDHNIMLQGDHTFPIAKDSRLTTARVAQLREKFGPGAVETFVERDESLSMRLRTLDDLRKQFNEPGKFLLIEGEEVTGRVHVNGINLRELIPPSVLQNNVASLRQQIGAIHDQGKRLEIPIFAHIDHPNWGKAISAEDIIAVPQGRFFEVYNGHGGVRNWGNEKLRIPDTDRKWDIILTLRLHVDPENILYGVATDDTHTYFVHGAGHQIPGRGWSMVLADKLETDSIVDAFIEGNFYASAGVLLDKIKWNRRRFSVTPRIEPGVTYTTQFIGTRRDFDPASRAAVDDTGAVLANRTREYSGSIGEVLHETTDIPAVYRFDGDEIYVRAKIVSTKLKAEPFKEGDLEMAWTQPVVLNRKLKHAHYRSGIRN